MNLSIMSVISTSLLMSLLICVLCTLFKRGAVLRRVGPKCMMILLFVLLVRMFLPFEFPYTYSIYIEDIFTPVRYFLVRTLFWTGNLEWTVWRMIILAWAISIAVLFVCKVRMYRRVIRLAGLLPEVSWDSFCRQYQINPEELKNTAGIRLVRIRDIHSPCLIGVKKRYLVLPEMDYGNGQMRYIILHELSHARKWDTFWKLLTELLCMVFWWNPVFLYLKREIFRLIEVKNDLLVAENFSEEERTDYMECLKDTAVQIVEKEVTVSVAFNRSDLKMLKERLEMLASRKPFSRAGQILLSICVCAAVFFTSTIIFEPFSRYNGEEEEVVLDETNTYLIRNEEGYDIYVYGEYVMTTEDLKPFDDVRIYDNAEEAEKNEKKKSNKGNSN